jgi:hypothetical protein
MFILFCVLQGLVQGFAWGVMIWLWTTNPNFPQTSSYPLIDFAIKTHFLSPSRSTADPQTGYDPADDLDTVAGDRSIRKLLKGRRTMIYKIRKTELAYDGKEQEPLGD